MKKTVSVPIPTETTVTRLERLIWSRDFTISTLAKKSGLGFATVWTAIKQGRMSGKTRVKLAQALQIDESDL